MALADNEMFKGVLTIREKKVEEKSKVTAEKRVLNVYTKRYMQGKLNMQPEEKATARPQEQEKR